MGTFRVLGVILQADKQGLVFYSLEDYLISSLLNVKILDRHFLHIPGASLDIFRNFSVNILLNNSGILTENAAK